MLAEWRNRLRIGLLLSFQGKLSLFKTVIGYDLSRVFEGPSFLLLFPFHGIG